MKLFCLWFKHELLSQLTIVTNDMYLWLMISGGRRLSPDIVVLISLISGTHGSLVDYWYLDEYPCAHNDDDGDDDDDDDDGDDDDDDDGDDSYVEPGLSVDCQVVTILSRLSSEQELRARNN